jgi:hypothetical protein
LSYQPARSPWVIDSEPPLSSGSFLAPGKADFEPDPPTLAAAPVAVFDNFWATTLSFAASLGKRGVPLHFYGNGAGRWSRYCTRRSPCPPIEDAERFPRWLRSRLRSGEISRVAPTSDIIAYYVSALREEFPPEVRRTIAPLDEIERCLIKTRFAVACRRSGQPTPASASPNDPEAAVLAAKQIGFPLVMKPKSHLVVGSAERGQIVRDPDALRAAYRRYPIVPGQEPLALQYPELCWPLLQTYVPSARRCVYSVSGFKDPDGGVVAASLSYKRRQWPPDIGISTSQISCDDAGILSGGLATLDRLLSRGIFELELVANGAELLAIDLNPRAFGFLALDMALGNDLPWLWFRSTLSPLSPTPQRAVRPVIESRLLVPHLIGRCVGWLCGAEPDEPARPRAQAQIPMLGHWCDPVPLLLSNLRLLRHPGGLIRPYIRAARR